MIRAQRLGYTFASGRLGLADVDLNVDAGEIVALVGPNGSGKTTLLRLLAGDLKPTTGVLTISHSHTRTLVAAEPVHFEELTGLENARFFSRARDLDRDLERWFTAFQLEPNLLAGEYSFGMQRKLLLVEALATNPDVLIIDEPTIGLDPPGVSTLLDTVQNSARRGAAVIIGTNDLDVAHLATRVVFLHEGRKVADAPPNELMAGLKDTKRLIVTFEGDDPTPEITEALARTRARVRDIEVKESDLGDVFRLLTGQDLTT